MPAADVFLSYRNLGPRRLYVRRLALALRVHGVSVWWDHSLTAGGQFTPEIHSALDESRVVMPLWCSSSIYSRWVKHEATLGLSKLVPAKLQAVVPPTAFADIHAINLVGWDGDIRNQGIAALIDVVASRLRRPCIAPRDSLEELEALPKLPKIPDDNLKLQGILDRLRINWVRECDGDFEDALNFDFNTPMTELFDNLTVMLDDGDAEAGEEIEADAYRLVTVAYPNVFFGAEEFELFDTLGDLCREILSQIEAEPVERE